MAFTKYTKDTTIIGALGTNPAERALTTQEFKDKFDQFAHEFVEWFNETHLPEVAEKAVVDEHLAEDASLEDKGHVQLQTTVDTSETVALTPKALATHEAKTVSKVVLVTEPYDQLTKTTVNLGFRPKLVQIIADIEFTDYISDGASDGTSYGFARFFEVSNKKYSITVPSIYFRYDAANNLGGYVTFTDTGIEITWTLNGTLTGAAGNRRILISATTH